LELLNVRILNFWDNSIPPKQSHLRNRSFSVHSTELANLSPDNDDAAIPKRADSRHGRRSSNASNKTLSRPTSRLSRRRANSGAASIGGSFDEKTGAKDKDKERSRRMSMAEWASNAMGTVTGGKGKKNKDKDAFAALDDGETGGTTEESRSSSTFMSIAKFASKSAPTVTRVTEDPTPSDIPIPWSARKPYGKKLAKALYDFEGGSDELSFKAGREIAILNEVLDDWWMGEVDGQTGLFPASYVEVLGLSSAHFDTSPSPSEPRIKAHSLHPIPRARLLTTGSNSTMVLMWIARNKHCRGPNGENCLNDPQHRSRGLSAS